MSRRLTALASIRVVLGAIPWLLKSCLRVDDSAFSGNPSSPWLLLLLFGFLCVLTGDDFVMNVRLVKVTRGLIVAALRSHVCLESAMPIMIH